MLYVATRRGPDSGRGTAGWGQTAKRVTLMSPALTSPTASARRERRGHGQYDHPPGYLNGQPPRPQAQIKGLPKCPEHLVERQRAGESREGQRTTGDKETSEVEAPGSQDNQAPPETDRGIVDRQRDPSHRGHGGEGGP